MERIALKHIFNEKETIETESALTQKIEDFKDCSAVNCFPHFENDEVKGSFFPGLQTAAYQAFEIVFSAMAILLLLPVMAVIAIIIKCDSKGPVLFFQKRVAQSDLVDGKELIGNDKFKIAGQNFSSGKKYWVPKTFTFVKFRTMVYDAKELYPHLYNYRLTKEEIEKFQFKVKDDPRVTRVGKWLRELTLDELPNFWNILRGEMRLIGPRPELPEMLQNYTQEQMQKFTVKPGITGLAQVNGRGNLLLQQTIKHDLEYVRTRSVALDLKVLLKTIIKVVTKHGAF